MGNTKTKAKKPLYKRIIKWTLISLGSLIGLFIIAAILIPIIFEDEIHELVKEEINANLNQEVAEVQYDDLSLSLFSNFPKVSINLEGLRVVGKGAFAKDTLISTESLQAGVSLYNILFEDKPNIKLVRLVQPRIKVVVLADGRANYDIALPDTTRPDPDEQPLELGIEEFVIDEGDIIYDDHTQPLYAHLKELDLETSGDINGDIYDLENELEVASTYVNYDGMTYLNKVKLEADLTVNIDNKNSKYTLKDNKISLNALPIKLDGWVAMPAEDIDMDLKFEALETDFKSILSLVPGAYTEDFDDIDAGGTLAFSGYAKGKMTDTAYPAFNVKLKVDKAHFQYPDLPAAVKGIYVDTEIDNKTGDLEQTRIDVRKLAMSIAGNPINAKMLIKGLSNPYYNGNVNAKLDLKQLTKVFPIEGVSLGGELALNAKVEGTASDTTLPKMTVNSEMKFGRVKSSDFPSAIENLNFKATVVNKTGSLADMLLELHHFHAEIDKQPLEAKAKVKNFDDPNFNLMLKGKVDLAKLSKIYDQPGTEMAGMVDLDVKTQGQFSQLNAGNYNLPAEGTIKLKNISYKSNDFKQGMTIASALMEVTPSYFDLTSMGGTVGKSDFKVMGTLSNYIGYLIKGENLNGNLTLNSNYLDVNEWMSDEESPAAGEEPEASGGAEPLPANIAFLFKSNIKRIRYDNMDITNFVGNVELKDQTITLQQNSFNLMDGEFTASGYYSAKTNENPKYNFSFGIQHLGIRKAYDNLSIVQKYAPVAKQADGQFNSNLGFSGELDRELNPVYSTLRGQGAVQLLNATVQNLSVLQKISSVTKLANFNKLDLGNASFDFELKDGRLHVKPFDVKQGNTTMNISGSNGIDGSLDYNVKLDMPTGQVGSAASSALKNLTGLDETVPNRIKTTLRIGGTYKNPSVMGIGGGKGDGKGSVKDAAKDKLKEEVDKQKEELKEKGKEELDKAKEEVKEKVNEEVDKKKEEVKEEIDKQKEELKDKLKDKIKLPKW